MDILNLRRECVFTVRSGDTEIALRILDMRRGSVQIGIEADETVRVAKETCEDRRDVRLAVFPR